MTGKSRSVGGALALLAGSAALFLAPRAHAQWADQRYSYRVPLTVSNSTTHAYNAGELVTATLPTSAFSAGTVRPDGADIALFHNGTQLATKTLVMGGSLKTIFALPASLGASNPYTITENQSAGKTSYAGLPAGAKLTFTGGIDDNNTVITLPFKFPFKTGTYDKLAVNIDGFCTPGAADAGRPDGNNLEAITAAASKNIIAPYVSDFMLGDGNTQDAASGVYADTTDPTKVTVRWEVKPSGQSTVVARFACQLYPDGKIRFIYSNLVDQDTANVTWCDPRYGVGVGDPAISLVSQAFAMSDHADILYTQTIPVPVNQTGYAMYFGGPSVSTPPAIPTGVQGWDFSDGQLHGWKSNENPNGTGGPNDDMRIAVDPVGSATSLFMGTPTGFETGDFVYTAQGMTPVGPQVVYTKIRTTGRDKGIAPMMRFNTALSTDNNGASYYAPVEPRGIAVFFEYGTASTYGVVTDRRAANTGNGREQTNFPIFGGSSYTIDENKIQYLVTASNEVDGATWVYGKSWQALPNAASPDGDPAPAGYQFGWDSSTLAPAGTVQTGKNAVDITDPTYLHWMWVVPNPLAELIGSDTGALETAPAPGPGKAVIQGVAYDVATGPAAVLGGIAITVKDAGGNTLASGITDVTGRYRFVINATATAANVTLKGTAPGKSGSVVVSTVENTVYNVDLAIAFGARAEGYIVDSLTGGGLVGATIKFLTPGTTTAAYEAAIDATGRYQVDMDSTGPYDVSVSMPGYAPSMEANKTFTRGVATTKHYALVAQQMLANGDLEAEEAAPNPPGETGAYKPAGFIPWNQTAAEDEAISNDMATMDMGGLSRFYYNRAAANRAHSGTHSVAIQNNTSVTTQWQNTASNLPQTMPGMMYRVSTWLKLSADTDMLMRVRFLTAATDPKTGSYDGLQYYFSPNYAVRDWQKIEAVVAAPTGGPRFLVVRPNIYGPYDDTVSGQIYTLGYLDDFSVTPIAPRLVTGKVVDAANAPVAGIVVGAASGRNGLADPDATAVTDAEGNFTLKVPAGGTLNLQTWKVGFMARSQAPVDTTAIIGPIGPLTLQAPSVPAFNHALAINASTTDGLGATGAAILDNAPDVEAFDGFAAGRGGGVWSQWRTRVSGDPVPQTPYTLTADLGKVTAFSQITLQWELRFAQDYEILASTDGSSYTSIYNANGLGYKNFPANSNETDDVITFASPVSARYIRLVNKIYPNASYSFALWEMRVETPGNTVTGTVQDSTNAPIANAFVGVKNAIGNVYYFGKTDATGAYSMVLPVNAAVDVVAHAMPSVDTIIAPTEPIKLAASAAGPINVGTIVLGAPTPNLMPTTTIASSDPPSDEAANPAEASVDRNLATRWGTALNETPTPDAPINMNFDMGSPVTFNQVSFLWEIGFPMWYRLEASTDGATYTPIYSTTSNYGGYPYADGKYMDVVKVAKTTARYLRMVGLYKETAWTSMWEVQLAATVPGRYTLTRQALRIVAGVDAAPTPATGADYMALDAVITGTSAGRIDLVDVGALAKQGK